MMSGGNKMLKRFTQLTAHPAFRRLSGEAFWVAFGIGLSTIGTFVGLRVRHPVLRNSFP